MGTITISPGRSSAAGEPAGVPAVATRLRPPIVKPRNRLPASPMNIRAGWKLCSRNPAQAPATAAERRAASTAPMLTKSSAWASAAMAATPAARPSMLSSRLNALVSATSHSSESSTSHQTMPVTGSRRPVETTAAATRSCAVSFVCGLRGRRSSVSPTRTQAAPPATTTRSGEAAPSAGAIAAHAPSASARPPNSGIVRRCHRSSRGRATAPSRCASGAQRNAARAATTAAPRAVTTRSTGGVMSSGNSSRSQRRVRRAGDSAAG